MTSAAGGDKARVVLISGASQGIGMAISRAFAANGDRVVMLARDSARLETAANAIGAEFGREHVMPVSADATDPSQVNAAMGLIGEHWGRIDVAVCNAGSGSSVSGWRTTPADWSASVSANLDPAVRITEAVVPGMASAGAGCLIYIASIAGREGIGAPLPYSAAKAALISYVAGLARELGPSGIRVNALAPGNILFDGGSWDTKVKSEPDRWLSYVKETTPLGRFGTPEEIAGPVLFLASEEAAFITGACLVVDGGQTRGI